MSEPPLQTIERVDSQLVMLQEEARLTLRGERDFNAESVRQLRVTIAEMAPIVAQSSELRRTQPEIADALDAYKSHLRELQTTITQIRVMLQLRRSRMEAGRAHVQAVSNWADTLSTTR